MSEVEKASFGAGQLVPPELVHLFAPGDILAEGDTGKDRRRRVFSRDYGYQPSVIGAPGIDGMQVVIYRHGRMPLRRDCGEGWKEEIVEPGVTSILGLGRASNWEWPGLLTVSHVYLAKDLMADTAAWALELDYQTLEATDGLRIEDQTLLALCNALSTELRRPNVAGDLLIDTIAQALGLHLLRCYHRHHRLPRLVGAAVSLTPAQRGRALAFIEAQLSHNFKLADLARAAGLSEYQFLRCFKNTFGESPHQYVMDKRVRRAIESIRCTDLPLAEIASATGFSDQAHMTRCVRKATGLTPGALRRE